MPPEPPTPTTGETAGAAPAPDRPPLRTGRLYRHPPLQRKGREKAVRAWWARHKADFARQADMVAWLDALTLPASGVWAYGRIPKTGTNTVLAALHQFEFGVPITTAIAEPGNTAPDTAPHHLDAAGIFMAPLQGTHPPAVLDSAFRFTVLRHPVARAVSSFVYLCRSHELSARQLAPVRLRLSAQTGFDWTRDPHTTAGFEKLVDFVEAMQGIARMRLDRHIAPQTAAMPRAVFRPHLVGRTEEMAAFLARLADAFGTRLPDDLVTARRNVTPRSGSDLNLGAALRARVERVFHDDMEWYETA